MQTVLLETLLPVVIVYWTVSVGATGQLRFRTRRVQPDPAALKALRGE